MDFEKLIRKYMTYFIFVYFIVFLLDIVVAMKNTFVKAIVLFVRMPGSRFSLRLFYVWNVYLLAYRMILIVRANLRMNGAFGIPLIMKRTSLRTRAGLISHMTLQSMIGG